MDNLKYTGSLILSILLFNANAREVKAVQSAEISSYEVMKKIFFLFLLQMSSICMAQEKEIIINNSRPAFVNRSYLVVEQLRLTQGFHVNAATDGDFFVKVIDQARNVPVSNDQNYVRVETVVKSGVTSEDQLSLLKTGDVYRNFNYLDGIGRNIQHVSEQLGANKNDIVETVTYDTKGRADKSYIVQEHNNTTGAFRPNAVNDLLGMYGTETPYLSYDYESSPLDRVLGTTGPGSAWHTNGKSTSSKVKLNSINEVRKWSITAGLPRSTNYYSANQLTIHESESEERLHYQGLLRSPRS